MTGSHDASADLRRQARRSPSLTVWNRDPGEEMSKVEPEAVHVWYVVEDEITRVAGHPTLRRILSEGDWARWKRLAMEGDKERFLAARIILRHLLSAAFGVSPEAWGFEADEHGRPHVTDPASQSAVRFNITHTSGLVACAVSGSREVGIDAEAHDRRSRTLDVARRFFAPGEVGSLEECTPRRRREVFFGIWTLKEAYVKAIGKGLALPLDSFSFDLAVPPPEVPFQTEIGDADDGWAFALERPTPRHSLAVAVHGGGGPVRVCVTPVTAEALGEMTAPSR